MIDERPGVGVAAVEVGQHAGQVDGGRAIEGTIATVAPAHQTRKLVDDWRAPATACSAARV